MTPFVSTSIGKMVLKSNWYFLREAEFPFCSLALFGCTSVTAHIAATKTQGLTSSCLGCLSRKFWKWSYWVGWVFCDF